MVLRAGLLLLVLGPYMAGVLLLLPQTTREGPDPLPEWGDSLRLGPHMISLCHWPPGVLG